MISKWSGPNCITVYQTYEISKHGFDDAIDILMLRYPGHNVFKRSRNSLKREWAVHNLLYNIGLFRKHTANTDFNIPLSFKEKLVYDGLGWLCLLLIN